MAQAEIWTHTQQQNETLKNLETLTVSTDAGGYLILYNDQDIIRLRFSHEEAKAITAKLYPHIH